MRTLTSATAGRVSDLGTEKPRRPYFLAEQSVWSFAESVLRPASISRMDSSGRYLLEFVLGQ